MYPTSSQRRYWTFENEEEIAKLRIKHNQEFIMRHRYQLGLDVRSSHFGPSPIAIVSFCVDFHFRTMRARNISWHPAKSTCCWKTMNCIWKIFVAASSRQCQNVSSALHSTISNDSICTTRQWITTRKKFCESIFVISAESLVTYLIFLVQRNVCLFIVQDGGVQCVDRSICFEYQRRSDQGNGHYIIKWAAAHATAQLLFDRSQSISADRRFSDRHQDTMHNGESGPVESWHRRVHRQSVFDWCVSIVFAIAIGARSRSEFCEQRAREFGQLRHRLTVSQCKKSAEGFGGRCQEYVSDFEWAYCALTSVFYFVFSR